MHELKPIVSSEEAVAEPQGEMAARAAMGALVNTMRSGAGWFFWIAGLSIINSVISLASEQGGGFVVGLGVTQIVDFIAYELTHGGEGAESLSGNGATIVLAVAFAVSAAVSLMFVGFGWMAKRGRAWAFIVGMVLYALDGMLFFRASDWLSFGFHLFALYGIFVGYRALRNLSAMTASAAVEEV